MHYDPMNWYWLADDGRLFSSAVGHLVKADDEDYQSWIDEGRIATRWPIDELGKQTFAALDDVLRPYGLSCTPAQLSDVKAKLKAEVDVAAETERLKYITPGNGQAMTYLQKVAEAQAFKAANGLEGSHYPILSSEVGITAETLDEVADTVLAAFEQWQQIGAAIECVRLGAKRDIDAAADEAAARAIVDVIEWPQPAL